MPTRPRFPPRSARPPPSRDEDTGATLVVPQDMTVESGDLTPSLKLKRQVVERKYRALIEDLYRDALAQL